MKKDFSFGDSDVATITAPDARGDADFPERLDRIVGPAIASREAAIHARTAAKLAERDANRTGYAGTGSKLLR
jgi:hypothetical protein